MNEQVYSKEIVEFVTVGVEFCSLLERTGETERGDYLLKLARILPLLYLKATLLPTDESNDMDELENCVTEEQYEYLRGNIARLLGKDDDYLEVFEVDMAYSDTPLAASISENLADIYQDIRDFLEIYRLGNENLSQAAICRCRENFVTYWGQKAVNVMRPLHGLCFNNEEEDDQENERYDETYPDAHHHHCDDTHCGCHHHED